MIFTQLPVIKRQ